MGKPFLPFQQLLAVLPAASIDLLPKAYHTLMTDSNSSLIEYYPVDFETDLNGKKQEWEAVVLIPFIDETKLLAAMKETAHLLTDSEKKRNVHGPMLKYQYSEKDLGFVPETRFGQPAICHNFCKETPIWRDEVIDYHMLSICNIVITVLLIFIYIFDIPRFMCPIINWYWDHLKAFQLMHIFQVFQQCVT